VKHLKKPAFALFFLLILSSGLYAMKTTTRMGVECDCKYPNTGQYGKIVTSNPEGTAHECMVTNCWIPLD